MNSENTVPDRLRFMKCDRGFALLHGGDQMGFLDRMYCFDRVEDLAAWIVEKFGEKPAA